MERAGHCTFTPAETIAGVQTLLERLETGKWPSVDATDLNKTAVALGPTFNIFGNGMGGIVAVPPAFVDFKPSRYLRPFDAEDAECGRDSQCADSFLRLDPH